MLIKRAPCAEDNNTTKRYTNVCILYESYWVRIACDNHKDVNFRLELFPSLISGVEMIGLD